jgi:hypothetical protein
MVRPHQTSLLLEPGAPMWAQRMADRLDLRFVALWPQAPIRLPTLTKAELPKPSEWTACAVYVSDVKKIAVSDGAAWRDAMGGLI